MEIDIDGEVKRALKRSLDVVVNTSNDDDGEIRIKVTLLWDGEKFAEDCDFIRHDMLPTAE